MTSKKTRKVAGRGEKRAAPKRAGSTTTPAKAGRYSTKSKKKT